MPEPNPKPAKGTATAERRARSRANQAHERQEKQKVRLRDKVCRFPLCGCKGSGRALECSHSVHKQMGGNPKGDRSDASLMVLLCPMRHRESRFSLDRGTVRWEALSLKKGANGPLLWVVDSLMLPDEHRHRERPYAGWTDWQVLAIENRPGWLEPPTDAQRRVLAYLATHSI